jgi:hypothetical protein
MTVTLGCDCSFRSSARLLWARVREEGYYRTVEGAIVFTRPGWKTVWPYKLAGADLDLQENGEIHRYRRLQAFSCPG